MLPVPSISPKTIPQMCGKYLVIGWPKIKGKYSHPEAKYNKGQSKVWVLDTETNEKKYVGIKTLKIAIGDYKRAKDTRYRYKGNRKEYLNLYKRWHHMVQRCTNPDHKDYSYYGARGITVCSRWLEKGIEGQTNPGFNNFLMDMGCPLPGYTLDRINNDKGYSKSNCRWATVSEQNANRRPVGSC